MQTILFLTALGLVYLLLYYMTGSLLMSRLPTAARSPSRTLILGFFTYFFLFHMVCLPLKLTLQPLSTLCAIWRGVLLCVILLFVYANRGSFRKPLQRPDNSQLCTLLVFALLVLVQLILIESNDESYALWDQSYYIGDAATSLYTNTISQYDPYTGRLLSYLNNEYLLETYQNHTAVMSSLLGLHPLVENLSVMAGCVVVLYNAIAYELGKALFGNNRQKALLMVGFLTLLNLFSFNLHAPGEFLFIRPSEGKTILAVLIIPSLLLFFLKTLQEHESRLWWGCSLVVILGSFSLNMSTIYMIPFEISAFYLPLAIRKRRLSYFLRYLILLSPCVLMAVAYLLTKHKFLIYTS